MARAAGDDSLAVLAADNEGALQHAGHNCDACGLVEDVQGDAPVLCIENLVEDNLGSVDAGLQIVP